MCLQVKYLLLEIHFCELPGSMLDKLKALHSEVFSKINWGRLVVFFNFVETLGLTDEEWEQVFDFLVPNLSQSIPIYQ